MVNLVNNINLQWIILILIYACLFFVYVFDLKLTNRKIFFLGILFIINLIILGLKLEPPFSFDLYRYYDEMKYYRTLDYSQSVDMIFSRANFLWYAILRIFSLFKYNNILIVFTMLVNFGVFFKILLFVNKKFYLNNRQKVLSILIFLSIVSLIHTMSGLRNTLAVAIFSLGMFKVLFKNKIFGWMLMIISILIHPMTIIFLAFYLLYKLLIKINFFEIILIFWKNFAGVLLFIIGFIPVKLFKLYADKLNYELNGEFGTDFRLFTFEIIQFLIIFFILRKLYLAQKKIILLDKKELKKINKEEKYTIYLYTISCFVIGSITLVNIFIRCRFIIAYFIPIIFAIKNKYLGFKYNKMIEYIMLFSSLFINFYYIYYMMCNGVFV